MRVICQNSDGRPSSGIQRNWDDYTISNRKLSNKTFLYNLTQLLILTMLSPRLTYALCRAKAKRLTEPKPKPVENYAKTLGDIELGI